VRRRRLPGSSRRPGTTGYVGDGGVAYSIRPKEKPPSRPHLKERADEDLDLAQDHLAQNPLQEALGLGPPALGPHAVGGRVDDTLDLEAPLVQVEALDVEILPL